MGEIKAPKKERKFLKAMGEVALTLFRELVLGVGKKLINKVGNKRQGLVIAFALVAGISYASIDSIPYPITGNKQRLGFQTTGNGLVWRGTAADTVTKPTSYADKNIKAYLILDSVSGSLYVFKQGAWAAISGAGGFEQPIDSLFFDTSVPSNNVDTAKMRWDSEVGTVVLGMYDQVPNELGFKSFWLVKNQTGSTITKGSIVYANGTVGASGRITIDKFIADGSIDAKYLLGITAHDLTDGEDGYVISFGKIRQVNTDTFADGSILYPSATTAGVWTDVEPVAPNIDMPIGFCINSHVNNGTIAIRVASGYDLSELHDVSITSPVEKASLYYSGGLWRDTTPTLLVSDTAAMLANYATKEYADTTGRLYARQDFTNVSTSTLTWTQTDTLIPGEVTVVQVYRNGQILLPSQYTIPTSTSVVIAATSFKVNDNYTVIFPRGGGAGSGGGSGSLTSISGGTGILVSPDPITTTGTVSADLSVLMELSDTASLSNRIYTKLNISDTLSMLAPYFSDADTSSLNLTSRFALKLNAADTASLSSRIDAKGTGTVTSVATGYGITGGTITTTGTLLLDSAVVFSQIRDSIVDVAIGNDTIKILKQEYTSATTSVLTWTVTPKFPIQLKAYILVFRNGQLLINDQYNLTDTNQITIVSNSFKVGANYTVVTVSGIGSVGSAQGSPVYPEAGIAVSTGTTWTTSIPNNSANWNIAFNDKINNAAFSGTTTKTLTLSQYDGGTFTPTFTDLQGIVAADTASMLTNYLRSGVAASTYLTQSNAASTYLPLTGGTLTGALSGTTGTFTELNVNNTTTEGIFTLQGYDNNTATKIQFKTGGNIRRQILLPTSNSNLEFRSYTVGGSSGGYDFYVSNGSTESLAATIGTDKSLSLTGTLGVTGALSGTTGTFTELNVNNTTTEGIFTLQGYDNNTATKIQFKTGGNIRRQILLPTSNSNLEFRISTIGGTEGGYSFYTRRNPNPSDSLAFNIDYNGNSNFYKTLGVTGATTLGSTLAVTGNITEGGNNVLTNLDTASLSSRIDLKYDKTGGTISGSVTLSTTTATPSTLLGKDGSNVVGTVTTVAQTGLMTRGETTATTGSPSATFTVTHGLGSTPTAVLVTSAGIGGGDKIIFEVYTKNNTTFSVQAWNYDGTEASGKEVKIYWLALK